jgi:hypothetical protein
MDAAVNDFELQRFVNPLRYLAIDLSVRSHFDAALTSRPVFRSAQQLGCCPPPSVYIQNEPPFQKTYRLPGVAAIGMRAQADLDEAGQTSGGLFRNENDQRHRSASVSCQDWRNFLGMLCRTCLGPKRLVHARERITVGGGAAPHLEGRRAQTLRSYRKTRCCSICPKSLNCTVAEFRRANLADPIVGPGTRLRIAVEPPTSSHEITFQKLTAWLDGSAKSPREGLLKSQLRAILGG